jgi:hypothetical protein
MSEVSKNANVQSAGLDLSQWDFAESFTYPEAAALIAGVMPGATLMERVIEPIHMRLGNASMMCAIAKLEGKAIPPEAIDDGSVLDPHKGTTGLKRVGLEMLGVLDLAVGVKTTVPRSEIVRWLDVTGLKSKYQFDLGKDCETLDAEKPLRTTERSTLLRMVIGMAIKGYTHDPAASKSTAPKEIADDMAALGMTITDDTVRKYLKQAADTVLPANRRQP